MTKSDIINLICNETKCERCDVYPIVESFMKNILEANKKGKTVYLRGFGTFGFKFRKKKTVRHLKNNTPMTMEAHTIPFFFPCKEHKIDVRGLNVEIEATTVEMIDNMNGIEE